MAAYSSVWSVEFAVRPSERCLAASTLRPLLRRLQTRAKIVCQRLLTVGKWVCGGVLERGEGCVLLETLGKVLGSLRIKLVLAKAANKEITQVSAAADGRTRCGAAYSTSVRVLLLLSISASATTPEISVIFNSPSLSMPLLTVISRPW